MKPEGRSSFRYSFRRSFRRKKVDEENVKSPEEVKAEQERAFAELKASISEISDPNYDDDFLIRFLKARDYDAKEAEKLFRTHVACRKLMMLDKPIEANDNIFQLVKAHCFSGIIGFDKEGSLIRIINYGTGDLIGFTNAISTVDILKALLYYMYEDLSKQREENKRTGRNAQQIVYIINAEHVSSTTVLQKSLIDTEMFALKLFQDHFYDIAKHVYVINAPAIFSTVYKMVKPVLRENLRKVTQIFGTDKWKEVLLEHIDADVLPAHFGGNRVDKFGDPKCSHLVCYGSEVPRSLYENRKEVMKNEGTLTKISVEAGAFYNVSLFVKEANSLVKYVVLSKEHDINLAIFYESPEHGCRTPITRKKGDQKEVLSRLEQLTPFIRCQSHIRALSGHLLAFKSGTYVLHIDNTYSWMNPKEVYYRFVVEKSTNSSTNGFNSLISKASRMKLV